MSASVAPEWVAHDLTEVLALARELAEARGGGRATGADVLKALLQQDGSSVGPLVGIGPSSVAELIDQAAALATASDRTGSEDPGETEKLVALAVREATALGRDQPAPAHLLLALVERGGPTAALLAAAGATAAVVRNVVARHHQDFVLADRDASDLPWMPQDPTQHMLRFGQDVTELAKVGRLDPLVGRDAEVERVIQVLARRTKSNPVLIGEPGVGKTSIVEGLAQRIVAGEVPASLQHRRIVSLDVAALVAGAKFRGEFEERLKGLLGEIARVPESTILFIDEMHTIVGAGAAEGGVDAANMLKPMLARGEIQTIGATTIEEYRLRVERDAALERRFQPVHVSVPDVSMSIEILRGLRPRYEAYHDVEIADDALVAAAELSDRYITGRFLPDKAVDLMDEAAGIKAAGKDPHGCVEPEDIAGVVARWSGIPVTKLLQSDATRLVRMERHLHQRVVGQDAAVRGVSIALRNAMSGLADPCRPIGSFLFAGPTGVGKTLLARALAEFMFATEDAMVRFDMSEFMEREAVNRLIGAPPGYVGHEHGGQLTEAVRQRPYSLLLFDEIEKAHHDVQNLLLQVMDEGRLTDGRGRTVDFRNVIVILTSNLGDGDGMREHFRPEFLNRLDDLLMFAPLTRVQLEQVAAAEIAEVVARAAKQGVALTVTNAALKLAVTSGCGPEGGARALRRVVRRDLLAPVSHAVLAGGVGGGVELAVDAESEAFVVRVGGGLDVVTSSPLQLGAATSSSRSATPTGRCTPGATEV